MDKATIVQHLEETERHLARGNDLLARQKVVIAQLEARELDTTDARNLLAQLEEAQDLHEADRARLIKELGEA